jgi:hypothetical protein
VLNLTGKGVSKLNGTPNVNVRKTFTRIEGSQIHGKERGKKIAVCKDQL